MPTIEDYRAQVEAIDTELRGIDTAAGGAELTAEQSARWTELMGQRDEPAQTVERMQRAVDDRARWRAVQVGQHVDPVVTERVMDLPATAVRDRGLAVLDSPEAGHLNADQRAAVATLIRADNGDIRGHQVARMLLATQRQEYRHAFMRYCAGDVYFLPEEVRAIREVANVRAALNITTDASGGFAVPIIIDPTVLLSAQGTQNEILNRCRVETITNDVWRGLSSAGVTWKFRAEATATTDGSPTIAQPTVATQRADGFIRFSVEIQGDWPSFAEQMTMLFGEGYSEILVQKLTTGTVGSNEPNGFVSVLNAAASGSWVELTTAGTLGAKDIYGLWAALPQRFRGASVPPGQVGAGRHAWMSSTGLQNSVRQLAGTAGASDPNFTVTISDEVVPRLFGREYPLDDYMQSSLPSGTGTQALVVVGDWQQYLVAQRVGMTIEYIPHMFDVTNNLPTGERGYFAWARVGGDVLINNAFRLLRNRSA